MSQLSRAEHAYQQILTGIRSGELAPGSRIRETELATWLEISRTPVREAILRLQSEGLISHAPRKGMIVSELDYQEIMELYHMREVLESTAAGLAAKHASEPEICALQDIVQQQGQNLDDVERQSQHNRIFHNALYHAAHNRYLLNSLNALRDAMSLLGATTYVVPGRAKTALAEHELIVQAIAAGDAQAAEQAARQHIRAAQQARIRVINEEMALVHPSRSD